APELSPATIERDKMGFTFPFERWMRDVPLDENRSEWHGVDEVAGRRIETEFRRGKVHWARLWALAVLRGMRRHGHLPAMPAPASPRRILLLLSEVYASRGGIQAFGQSLIRGVAEAFPRAEVRVVSANDVEMPAAAAAAGRAFFRGCGPRSAPLRRIRMTLTVAREVLRHRPDVLVCGHINFAPLASALRLLGAPRAALLAYGIEAWAPSAGLRWAARRLGRTLAISRYTAQRMIAWGMRPGSMSILPVTVDGEAFRRVGPGRTAEGPTILTVARLDARERSKGVDRVIAQIPALRRRFPGLAYVIGGSGDDVPRLSALAEQLGVSDAVHFVGEVP
ncbi:MAG: hypothetical protein AUI36_22535, partial [Cyanobacteria bacterium 13_1_40CM_2_61_4]